MDKVFITGGAGFIGYFVAKRLLDLPAEVVIYDSFQNYISPLESHYPQYLALRLRDLDGKVKIIRGDVRHRGHLVKSLKETRPDVVIHLAAIPIATVSNEFSEGAMEINLGGTVTLLECLRVVDGVKRLVFASSSFVYGDFQYHPADEAHPTSPIDLYGATKLSGEILVRTFSRRFGIEHSIVRPSAVYGPTDCNRRVSQIFVESALKGLPLVLHNGGQDRVDFTYVDDVAQGITLAAFAPEARNETFNMTRGEGRSTREFADILRLHIPNLQTVEREPDSIRPKRGGLAITKAKRLLGYSPQFSLEDGLAAYVRFVKQAGAID